MEIRRSKAEVLRSIPEDSVKIDEFKGFKLVDVWYSPSEDQFYKWNEEFKIGKKMNKSKDNGIYVYTEDGRSLRLGPKKWKKQWEKDHTSIEEVQNKV